MAMEMSREETDEVVKPTKPVEEMTDEEMTAHLEYCLKLFQENKITRDNAFDLLLIPVMKRLLDEEKEPMCNFQNPDLGITLQASSEIYSECVDDLYDSVKRLQRKLNDISESFIKLDDNNDSAEAGRDNDFAENMMDFDEFEFYEREYFGDLYSN